MPILGLGLALAGGLRAQSGLEYRANTEFSTSNGNPNGPWTYLAGATALPLTANWNANGTFGCTVPSWAPSNNAGNLAPAFFQANSCVSSFFGTYLNGGIANLNVTATQLVVRTSDDSSVRARLLFTAPANPVVILGITSQVWNARLNSQPQDWILSVKGVQVASGVLSGTVNFNNAQVYSPNTLPSFNPGDTVELDVFKDSNSTSGDFVGVTLNLGTNSMYTTTVAEIDTYNTTNVTQQVNSDRIELKAHMQGGAYLYDQTFSVPFTDPSIGTAIAQARSVLTDAGALSFAGPTQLSSTQSTSSTTNTVQTVLSTKVYIGSETWFGPQTIVTGDLGICQTSAVPPASTSTAFYPVLTGCTDGTTTVLYAGGQDIDTMYSVFDTISKTVTTTSTTLTSQAYEIDGFTSTFSPCDINQDTKTNVVDAQGVIKEALGVTSPGNELNGDGAVNVVEIQIVTNAAMNLGCSATSDAPASVGSESKTAVRNPGPHSRATANPAPRPTITAVRNAADLRRGPVSPGEVVVLIGTGFGPGVRVLFDGTPAPLTYVSAIQITCVVPYEVQGKGSTDIQVSYEGQTSGPFSLASVTAIPALFTANGSGAGPAAVLNQDGSHNSPANPAARGSTVILFLTGEGQTSPPGITGKVIASAIPLVTPQLVLPVSVLIGGQSATVAFYGEAPGLVPGVLQLNVEIPSNVPYGDLPISVSVGGNRSQRGVTVSVRER